MADRALTGVLRHIRHLIDVPSTDELTDGQLLERFALQQDEAAFEALVQRHGSMVLNLCRGLLHDTHSADDVFQATFLVLARKATSIRKRQSVASWLYGVAYRIAQQARVNAARRCLHERRAAEMPPVERPSEADRQEMQTLLSEELRRLPERYRAPLILCYLEGKSNETAARALGLPRGSMSKRLSRARDLLRDRLLGRGVALSTAALAAALTESVVSAAVPAPLLTATLKAATLFGEGSPAAAGAIPESVVRLANGALHAMTIIKLKIIAILFLALTLTGGGLGMLIHHGMAQSTVAEPLVQLPKDPQTIVLSLDYQGGGRAEGKEPYLTIRADASAVFGNPQGDSRRLEMKLAGAELQELLRCAIREHDIFACDGAKLAKAMSAGALRHGLPPDFSGAPHMTLHVRADGRDHEVRCPSVTETQARGLADVKSLGQVRAVQQRLERLVTWMQAGGHAELEKTLRVANEQLRKQFPEAPPFAAADLQTARLHADGRREVTLQRRGVAADRDPFTFVYAHIERADQGEAQVTIKANLGTGGAAPQAAKKEGRRYLQPLNVEPTPIAKDPTVVYDYDIVYVRAPRKGDKARTLWAEVGDPRTMEPGADLMLLHPNGSEEILVPVQPNESIADPFVSFDGQWVYYAKMHDAKNHKGSDIYKIHVPTRKIVQLTQQKFTPNTGAADWSKTPLPSWGVYNLGPTPVPGGKVAFVSDRNAFKGTNTGYAPNALALQLFVMDDAPPSDPLPQGAREQNVECIGHLNLGSALHPVILKDGRLMFSSLESQGLRSHHLWGIWAINPDGSNWGPLVSAFDTSNGTTDSFHFQTQLSDGHIVCQSYYNLNNFGFGLYFKQPVQSPDGYAPFGPANPLDPRNPAIRNSRYADGRPMTLHFPFSPYGIEPLTPFITRHDEPAPVAVLNQKDSPRVGKFTHPSGAPDNHLLTAYAAGSVNGVPSARLGAALDSGIYLIKSGKPIDEPGQMLLIKNDPKFNEQWPRALVPYQRIYGIDEPPRLAPVANDGKRSKYLPEGTPFGLVGTSSLYKRESYPYGTVPPGGVTATFADTKDRTGDRGIDSSHNWNVQGADAGLYGNDDIHAIRIILLEPNTDRQGGPKAGRLFYNHAKEKMRILGEFPVRKFKGNQQPLDPDGNPDTSFLARIPADVAWTFQTLDRHGMVLNMAQTWHQVRPGEIRNDCGGCHAHSQKPTLFEQTAAAKPDYVPFDLTEKTPLLTTKQNDQSGKRWDANDETGLRFEKGPKNVEFHRDIKPIFARSCVACHTQSWEKPAGNLVLDDDTIITADGPVFGPKVRAPGTYIRLAADSKGQFGYKPLNRHGWTNLSASRYVRLMQARRSLLIWKVFGQRLDGFTNDAFPHEAVPGDPKSLTFKGQPFVDTPQNREQLGPPAYTGGIMPPPEAVAGTYAGPAGKKIKVAPLSDEDRRTLVRWIDLGCPVDLDYDPAKPADRGYGWMLDDNRPTLTLTYPKAGVNESLTRLLVGMHDLDTGLDLTSFRVVADVAIDGVAAGANLAPKFQQKTPGVWELVLAKPLTALPKGKLTVSVKDRQGNVTRVERTFSVVSVPPVR